MVFSKSRNYELNSDLRSANNECNRHATVTGYSNAVSDASAIDRRSEAPKPRNNVLPIHKSGPFSYIFVTWFSPLVWKLFQKRDEPIEESDIWQCSEEEGVNHNTGKIMRIWKKELDTYGSKKASFYRVWTHFIRKLVLMNIVVMVAFAGSSFLSAAYLVNLILAYLDDPDDNTWYGVGLIVAMACSETIRACSSSVLAVSGAQTGARFRSGMNGIVFDKLLKLRTLKGTANSMILNAFSVDSYRLHIGTMYVPFLLSVPISLIIATAYFYIIIGYWCFLAIGTFAICYITQTYFIRNFQQFRKNCAPFTDKRIKRMGEVLNSMKFIKICAWERPFKDVIEANRQSEQKYLLYSAIVNALSNAILFLTPTISSVVTISVYIAVGNYITVPKAFSIIGTMNFLRVVVAILPIATRVCGEAKVSLDRITTILHLDECIPTLSDCSDPGNAIEINMANFYWENLANGVNSSENIGTNVIQIRNEVTNNPSYPGECLNTFNLTNINIDIRKGQLVGVCGAVGSGKSSLMSAVLGRMHLAKGHLSVNGSLAYVAQQASIFNGTVKENITFGLEYDHQWFMKVIRACGLETDLLLFEDGDQTEIGERGINLSGGQKQRVSLARAVYSNNDIYILDDPMSALDVRVGKQVFHSCIKGTLKDKTVLLVTHQLQYLDHCDVVVVMDEGLIVESGRHVELLNDSTSTYSEMYGIYQNTTIQSTINNEDGDTKVRKKSPSPFDVNGDVLRIKSHAIDDEMAKPQNCQEGLNKGKLVVAEEMAVGTVSFSTYKAYIKAAGGWFVASVVMVMFSIASGSLVFSDWCLSALLDSRPDKLMIFDTNTTQTNSTTNLYPLHETTESSENMSVVLYSDTVFLVYVSSVSAIVTLQVIKGYIGAKVLIRASNKLHTQCLEKVMKAPMLFFDTNPAGRILNRFSRDLDDIDVFIPLTLDVGLQLLYLIIVSFAVASYITPWILIAIVPIGVFFSLTKYISTVSLRQLKRLENIVRSPLIGHVNVTLQSLPTIISYGQQQTFYDKMFNGCNWEEKEPVSIESITRWLINCFLRYCWCTSEGVLVFVSLRYLASGKHYQSFAATVRCARHGDIASLTVFLFEICNRWISLRLDLIASCMTVVASVIFILTKGLIPVAYAGLVLSLCGKTACAVQVLLKFMNEVEARFTSVERLHEYEQKLPSEDQYGTRIDAQIWPTEGVVAFRDVVMRYRPDMEPVLRSLSFDIRPCEKIGVVGRTGAGKSSLVTCLLRLVELDEGTILVDGQDISKLSLSCIRSRISTIPQDPVLFNGSMRQNIDPLAVYSDDEIWEALEKVHMKERICQFVGDIEVMVDENGENFSVGERQLISLARAVLRRSKIMLLDEATANIDTSTDAMIQDIIRTCFVDCTVITIAHRLNTILHSDRIIVMDAGKVVEFASPEDLLADADSLFNKMIAAQSVKISSK